MKFDQKQLRRFLSLYSAFYVCLYVGYIFIINILHSSYSVVSIPAILLPFIFLLLLELVIWKHTDNNLTSDRKVKNKYKIITSLGSMPPLLCAFILGKNEYKSIFTVDKWINNHTERVYMIDDLLNDFDLNDKTKDEVISLLGKPTETEYFKDDNNIVYYLGTERGLIPIDSEWLVIDFDGSERVKKYDVLTD